MLKKLRDCFPDPATASNALTLLDRYGLESWHPEKDRVQLALLKLSGAELDRLLPLVDLANDDYRDVLAPAEFPEESAAHFPPPPADELRAMRQRDRKQYLDWLTANGP